MWIERIDDLCGLAGDLAPPLLNLVVGDVLGTDVFGAWDLDEEWPIASVLSALTRFAHGGARELFRASVDESSPYYEFTARHQERLEVLAEGEREHVVDLLNLAFARHSGRASYLSNTEDDTMTITAARRTKGEPKGKVCVGCGTSRAGDVGTCPVCGDETEYVSLRGPAPSSAFGAEAIEPATKPRPTEPESRSIPVDRIDPSPYQRRKHFDAEALGQLAASITDVGVLQPVLVRPKDGGRYELVAGERRLRATKLAGLAEIPATVRRLTDEQAAQACARENLDREDLDAIEEAETLKVLLDVGGLTQEELAKRLRRTQGWISNRLRLLELPESWQARIISREIPPTHARELLTWKHRPAVLDRVEIELEKWVSNYGRFKEETLPPVKVFRDLVYEAAQACSKGLAGHEIAFKLTAAVKADLDVETFANPYGSKDTRAFNVARWNQLQRAAKKAEKKANGGKPKPSGGYSYTPPTVPNEYEIGRRVAPWLARQILGRIGKADKDLISRLFLLLSPDAYLEGALGIKNVHGSQIAVWSLLVERSGPELAKLQREMVFALLEDFEQKNSWDRPTCDAPLYAEVLRYLGGDPLAYRVTAEDLGTYHETELRKMPGCADVPPTAHKTLLQAAIADVATRDGWLPHEFVAALSPKKPKAPKKAKPR